MSGIKEMAYRKSAGNQGVGDERTVAAPWDCLRAEEDEAALPGQIFQVIERGGKLRGLHVVGEASETCVSPGSVWRIPLWTAQASKGNHMLVSDVVNGQRRGKGLLVELRIVPGLGNRSDIDHEGNLLDLQDVNELFQGPRAVSEGQDGGAGQGRTLRIHRRRYVSGPGAANEEATGSRGKKSSSSALSLTECLPRFTLGADQ